MDDPFAVSQYTTWPLSFDEDLEVYRAAGVRCLELCEAKLGAEPAEQIEHLKAAGFGVASVQPRLHSLFPDRPRPEPGSVADRTALLRESLRQFGRHFPSVPLVTITGAAPGGNYAEAFSTAVREYKKLARFAADHGSALALEPLNPILMNVDTFICSLAGARRLVEAVDEPAFGVLLDVWHFWEEPRAVEGIAGFTGKILGVHIGDWRTPRAFGDRYLPGEGEIPLALLLAAIRRTGYGGAYTLELFSELTLPGSLWADPAGTVRKGKAAFEKIWRKACA